MATAITGAGVTLYPEFVVNYASRRASGNLLHVVIGRSDPDVTLKAAGLRTGTIGFICADLETAQAIEEQHAAVGVLTLVSDEFPGLDMSYVVSGSISVNPDGTRWAVAVDYAEVSA